VAKQKMQNDPRAKDCDFEVVAEDRCEYPATHKGHAPDGRRLRLCERH